MDSLHAVSLGKAGATLPEGGPELQPAGGRGGDSECGCRTVLPPRFPSIHHTLQSQRHGPHTGLLGHGCRQKGGNHSPRKPTHPELRLHSILTPHTHCHPQAGGPQLHHQPGGEYRARGWPHPWSFQPQRPRAGVGTSARSQGSLVTQQSGLATPLPVPDPRCPLLGEPWGCCLRARVQELWSPATTTQAAVSPRLRRGGRLCQGTAPPRCTLRLAPLRTLKGSSGKPMKTSVPRPPGKAEGREIAERSVPREHSANKQTYFIMAVNRLGHAPLQKLNLRLPGTPEVRPSSPTAWALLTWCSLAKPTQAGLNTPPAGRASPLTQQDRGDAACRGMECKLASGSRPWLRTLATRLPCRTAGVLSAAFGNTWRFRRCGKETASFMLPGGEWGRRPPTARPVCSLPSPHRPLPPRLWSLRSFLKHSPISR